MQTTIETPEELALIEALEKGELTRIEGEKFEKIKKELEAAADRTIERMTKRRAISIRLIEEDLERIKAMALSEGLPYQTLIGYIIHQYARGELKRRS